MSARERRKSLQRVDTLTSSIKALEMQNQTNADSTLKAEIGPLRQELRTHILDSFEKAQTRFKATHYSTGNKARKAMTTRLKWHYAKTKIIILYHPTTQKKLLEPQATADAFSHYYSTLYNLKDDPSVTQPSNTGHRSILTRNKSP